MRAHTQGRSAGALATSSQRPCSMLFWYFGAAHGACGTSRTTCMQHTPNHSQVASFSTRSLGCFTSCPAPPRACNHQRQQRVAGGSIKRALGCSFATSANWTCGARRACAIPVDHVTLKHQAGDYRAQHVRTLHVFVAMPMVKTELMLVMIHILRYVPGKVGGFCRLCSCMASGL